MQLAIALYNNQVDDDDELEFERGDILTVLIENPHGLDGWWLCQRQGKFGLCPGNRLKLISSKNGSTKDPTKFHHFPSRLSTASVSFSQNNDLHDIVRCFVFLQMYDAPSTNQDYDNARSSGYLIDSFLFESIVSYCIYHRSDLITNRVGKVSSESSTRSSGISSTVDGHHSTSSVDLVNRSSSVSTSERSLFSILVLENDVIFFLA